MPMSVFHHVTKFARLSFLEFNLEEISPFRAAPSYKITNTVGEASQLHRQQSGNAAGFFLEGGNSVTKATLNTKSGLWIRVVIRA